MEFEVKEDCESAIDELQSFLKSRRIPDIARVAIEEYIDTLSSFAGELPTRADLALKPEVLRLANLYAEKHGDPPVKDVYFSDWMGAWSTSNENSQRDMKIGETLGDAYSWLKRQVGDAG